MGSWGAGVYQNDHAADLFSIEIDELAGKIEKVLSLKPVSWDDIEGPLIYPRLLAVISKDCQPSTLGRKRAQAWKDRYLEIYDSTVSKTEYLDAIKRRRAVIVETFDDLIASLAEDDDDEPSPPPKKTPKAAKPEPKAKAKTGAATKAPKKPRKLH